MALETIIPCFADLIKEPFKKYVLSPIVRHIGYAFRCDSNVETLQNQVEKLKIKRLERQLLVNNATNNNEEILPSVTEWLTSAGNEIEDAETLIHGSAEAMGKCYVGLFPNLKSRYQLSKKAHKKALAADKQLQDAPAISDPISCPRPPQPIVEPSVYSSETLPSRVLILNQIMDALKDPNLNMIGVYGMGGVGKTRLAKEVKAKAIEEKMLFDTVVMVAVSQTPDLRRIQGEIADSLGLKLEAEGVPGRASQLHQRLEKAKVLIILDDVWQKLDLNDVGIPLGDAYEGCKIFLTSRRKDVLCNEMGTQKEFPLEVLREDETWRLFEMSLSNVIDPELHGIATEIAKKCAGLPLLILKVAADLRGKHSYAWRDMQTRLSSLENTEIYEIVHRVIESSYEQLLNEDAKSVFLLCALFGESNIEIHKLVMYCAGLGLFKGIDSIEGVRNRVLTLIDELKDECLLLDGDRVGFVKIHDVVHDIARVIASRVQHAFVSSGKVRSEDFQSNDCTRISLPHCVISDLPSVLECSKAKVFSLECRYGRWYCPSSFFEGASKLKIVDFTAVHIASGLPQSLGSLRDLKTLCLQGCQFDNVAIVAELKQLEVLTFAKSNIKELPGEMKGLTRLKLLDLTRCDSLKRIPANVLSNLSSLEELYLFNCFTGWESEGNASLEELKNLPHLKTLEIQVKNDKILPKDWFFDGVQTYRISVSRWNWYSDEYETSRRILKLELKTSMGLMHRIKEFVKGIEVLLLRHVKGVEDLLYDCGQLGIGSFGKLGILRISKCDTFKILFSPSTIKYLQQLQEVIVESCGKMEAIVGGGSEEEEDIEFSQLNSLELSYLPNLISFCKSSVVVGYPNLTKLEVYCCRSLKYVFTTLVVKSLKQLQVLKIFSCQSMEEIILSEPLEEKKINRIVFPNVQILTLCDLEKLKRFSSGYSIHFPSLPELRISFCQAIENLVSKFPTMDSDDKYVCLNNLYLTNIQDRLLPVMYVTRLKVHKCKSLKYALTASIVKSLKKLQELEISNCESMEEITLSEQIEEENINSTVFPQLESLKLENLQKFEKFSTVHPIDFPSLAVLKIDNLREMENSVSLRNLARLKVYRCASLKYVLTASIVKSLKQLQELEISNCESMEEIILSEQIEEAEENINRIVFPQLDSLKLENLKKFKRFCSGYPIDFPSLTVLKIDNLREIGNFVSKLSNGSNNNGSDGDCIFNELVSFSHLTRLEVSKCMSLKYLCTASSILKCFKQLQELKISDCESMEEIISSEETEEDNINRIVLPVLVKLRLENLKNLKRFSAGHSIDFPSLKVLEILKCSKIKNLVSKLPNKSSNNESDDCSSLFNEMVTFSNLTMLEVSQCMSLKYVCTTSTVKCLEQLQELEIGRCTSMEEIILSEETEEENIRRVEFRELHHLRLINLPNLKRFSTGHPVDFQSLGELVIVGCSAVENLVSKVSKFLTKSNENESVDKCLFNEMVTFFNLEKLYIEGMNKLRHMWSEDIKILNLQKIKVSNCPDLKYVFPALIACGLPQLQELQIENCGIEVIILKAKDNTFRMEWPELSYLKVRDCNKLLKCGCNYIKLFPNVKEFSLDCNCDDAIESDGTQFLCTSEKKSLILRF